MPYLIGTLAINQNLPNELRDQFKDLITQGVAETDPAARQVIYEQLNQIFYDQSPAILLAVATSHNFEQRWVKGTVLNPIYPGHYYYPMYKE